MQLALAAAQTAADNRGREIVILDMRELTPVFDYFVLATGTSRRQLHAMSEEIDNTLEKDLNDRRMGIEGYRESRWIVLDYGSVVVHLFDEETRSYYNLEQLWSQAQRVPFTPIGGELPPEDPAADAAYDAQFAAENPPEGDWNDEQLDAAALEESDEDEAGDEEE